MAVQVGGRGPGHMVRVGSFYPGAVVALELTRGLGRVGHGRSALPFASLPGLTVSRSSVGYAETSGGVLTLFQANQARITDKGLLVEEARTNLLLRSQEFDNASWGKTDVTVTANATTAPDGTLSADLLTEGTAGTGITTQTQTVVSGTTYTTAFYLKPSANNNWVRLVVFETANASNQVRAWVNISTGALGTANAAGAGMAFVSASVQSLVNGFTRVILTYTPTPTAISIAVASASADASTTRVNNAAYYAWQADNQAGSFITSPIKTEAASATRAADSISISLSPGSAGTFVVAARVPTSPNTRRIVGSNGASAVTPIGFSSTGVETFNGTTSLGKTATLTTGALIKGAVTWESGRRAITAAGLTPATDTNSFGSYTSIFLGQDDGLGASNTLNEYIERVIYYERAFSDAELQAATQ